MKNVFNFAGCQFASFTYTNSYGEISTYNVLLGADYGVAKGKDLVTLQNASFAEQGLEEARIRLVNAILKNLDPKTQSNQSKAQQDAYMNIGKGLRFHVESETVKVMAYLQGKTQSEEQKAQTIANQESGNFKIKKVTKSRQTTIDQNKVKKTLDLRERKIVQFTFSKERMTQAKVNGKTLTF
jgi:hypothetical protein